MNLLMCSVGRRAELVKDIRKSLTTGSRIIATDNSPYAPAAYLTDKTYLVPRIDAPEYIDILIDICKKENIQAVATFIDPEIEVLSRNRERFEEAGVELLVPYEETAHLCFDKFEMFKYLKTNGIHTVETWGDFESFSEAYSNDKIGFPVFVKPRTGSGSVGAKKIYSIDELQHAFEEDSTIIVQEFMDCTDLDADVYIDTISHEAVAAFSKYKLEMKIGGASKTVSFKDDKLFDFIKQIVGKFKFNGPVDMDFFRKDGVYYLSEVNPRFGGAYLHAYGAGVDFIRLIENNIKGEANEPLFGNYEEGVVMMMYDSVVICKAEDMLTAD